MKKIYILHFLISFFCDPVSDSFDKISINSAEAVTVSPS